MVRWEYKSVKVVGTVGSLFGTKVADPTKQFNELGAEGWELVSTVQTTSGGSKLGFQAIFKRPSGVA